MAARLKPPILDPERTPTQFEAELRRQGASGSYRNSTTHLRDLKGLADLAILLARPGTDVHVLELASAGITERHSGPLLDATARPAYRRRLVELDNELATAQTNNDLERVRRLDQQRAALIGELSRATGPAGHHRSLGTSTIERARKAVTARLRDAIHHITVELPELGHHLDQAIITGTTCRYHPTTPLTWKIETQRTKRPGG